MCSHTKTNWNWSVGLIKVNSLFSRLEDPCWKRDLWNCDERKSNSNESIKGWKESISHASLAVKARPVVNPLIYLSRIRWGFFYGSDIILKRKRHEMFAVLNFLLFGEVLKMYYSRGWKCNKAINKIAYRRVKLLTVLTKL